MSTTDRTWPEALDVPEHVVERLRAAARDELERACDNGGKWDVGIEGRVLDAARVVEVFDLQTLSPTQIAGLARRALHLLVEERLASIEIHEVSELIALRDAARARADLHTGPQPA